MFKKKKSKDSNSNPWHKSNDPHLSLESNRYVHPIPSREFILECIASFDKAVSHRDLINLFGLEDEEEEEAFYWRMQAMERDGQIESDHRGAYSIGSDQDVIEGIVSAQRDGSGHLKPIDDSEQLFVSFKQMRGVLDGDRVLARRKVGDRGGRKHVSIIEVIEHKRRRFAGRFVVEGKTSFVTPDDKRISQDILIPHNDTAKAKHGDLVIVELSDLSGLRSRLVGKITEVLGNSQTPGMAIDVAIHAKQLPVVWSDEVRKEAKAFNQDAVFDADSGYKDLRDVHFVTIDGEDAKDFDDAVFCKKNKNNEWILSVAIADVSHYVTPHSAIDEEAKQRGNSVYFPGRVIPMLPEELSNGLCSLKPNVDRLAVVCEMCIDDKGKLLNYQFYKAVINSKARLTYTKVARWLAEKDLANITAAEQALLPDLENLYALYHILFKARQIRKALDFDIVETRIVLDDQQKIVAIEPVSRNDAHRLIEECMLFANVATAKFLQKHGIPALFRVHQGPNVDKLTEVRGFLSELNLGLRGGDNPGPEDYAELLETVKDRPDARVIHTVLLRSLSQAVYDPDNSGHFGLAYEAYAHFTSPIRRYPDLLVHRAINHILANKKIDEFPYDLETMVKYGEHFSMTERRADDAVYSAIEWLKCQYMQDKLGEEYEGIITGVTSFGLFVQLQPLYIEGLVHITNLADDYYLFQSKQQCLIGENSRKIFRLGDTIKVRLAKVNVDSRQIDLELLDAKGKSAPKKKKNLKWKNKKHKRKYY